ncbi:HAD family hydrolase [Lacrimispora xylanisolvens]|uniref:HAD family hydrolase n=1 Tax=Lacrimispora xylanisolvens TaxID=384636 RepID=UPI002402A4AC
MNSKILVILIDDKCKERKEQCLESIRLQSYKEIETVVLESPVSKVALCPVLTGSRAEYVLFVHSNDRIGIDYCRIFIDRAESGAEVVAGEYLEEIGEEIFFPNRTFNQNELFLQGHEIEKAYSKLGNLDYSWDILWNKLYKKQLMLEVLEKINMDCGTEEELGRQINAQIFRVANRFTSVKNNYYYRKTSELPYSEYVKKNRDYFTNRYVKVENPLYFEKIKEGILNPEVKVVSFDVFDTLLLRPFLYPTDLFIVLEQYVNSIIPTTDGIGFQKLRMSAEMCARDRISKRSLAQDVTLNQIYEELEQRCSLLKPQIENIKRKEVELELQYCYQRKTGKELYDLARYVGKRVVYTSDMYLPVEVVEQLLKKNGFIQEDVFVSSSCGKTKASGDLYKYVIKKMHCMSSEIIHIGDNMATDVINARDKGIVSYHLPRAEELFNNWNSQIYSGSFFTNMFESRCGIVQNYDAKELFGIRCMMAVCANKLYDYPFVLYDQDSDFNGNPYNIGYFTLGMHIYAVARWLIEQTKREQYENLHFMARDGYLTKAAYQMLSEIFNVKTNLHYTYMSRKALMPLMLQSKGDCYNLMNCFNGVDILPEVVFGIIDPVIKTQEKRTLEKLCRGIGIDYNRPIGSRENFLKISELVATELYDEKKTKEFKGKFARCFDTQFSGKAATFDMGYSARGEAVLKENFGYDITANYIHTCLDKAYQRELKSGVKVNCFYDFTPYISGIARELLMSELSGSCIGYEFLDGNAVPQFEDFKADSGTYYAVHFMQEGALAFVRDMVKHFGDYNRKLLIRNHYASIPFDYYLAYSSPFDRSIFSETHFEDDMGLGNEIGFEKFWNGLIHRMTAGTINKIDYNSYGRVRRWLLILLCGDLGEVKFRVRGKLYRHKSLYHIAKSSYNTLKWIYHKIRK